MQESDTKTRWCPHTRVSDSDGKGCANRFDGSTTEAEAPTGSLCIASKCMAWRTGNADRETMRAYYSKFDMDDILKARQGGIDLDDGPLWIYEVTDMDEIGKYDLWHRQAAGSKDQTHGYCGLAGRP